MIDSKHDVEIAYSTRLDDRYQNQQWYIKLWRRRWYLLLPFYWLRLCWHCVVKDNWFEREPGEPEWEDDRPGWPRAKTCWKLELAEIHGKMQWYYTLEEVEAEICLRIQETESNDVT